jgi:hypothetical protein
MKQQRQRRRHQRRTHPLKTRMTPADQYTPLPETYEEFLAHPEPYRTHPMWDLLSPIEYYVHKDAIDKRTNMSIATRRKNISWTLRTVYMRIRISLFRLNRLTSCTTQVHQSRCYLLTSNSHGPMYVTACTPSANAQRELQRSIFR